MHKNKLHGTRPNHEHPQKIVCSQMNGRLVLKGVTYPLIAVALLHTSLGKTPLLQVTYSIGDSIFAECLERPSHLIQSGATFMFKEPRTEAEELSVVAVGR